MAKTRKRPAEQLPSIDNGQQRSPWDSVEAGFPWSFYQVEVHKLLKLLKMPRSFYPHAVELLVSQAGSRCRTKNESSAKFLQKVEVLSPGDRRRVLSVNSAGVYLRDGHALHWNLSNETDTIFPDDPVGWIRNGLWCIQQEEVPRLNNSLPCEFRQCAALDTAESPRAIPWIYTGRTLPNRSLAPMRAAWWFRDIRDGYAAAGRELSRHWCNMAPGTSVPDPVYRFLRRPSIRGKEEAEIFLEQFTGVVAPPVMTLDDRPPQFKHGPIACSKAAVNIALSGGKKRANVVDARLWTPQTPGGTIWQGPDAIPRQHSHDYWFLYEETLAIVRKHVKGA